MCVVQVDALQAGAGSRVGERGGGGVGDLRVLQVDGLDSASVDGGVPVADVGGGAVEVLHDGCNILHRVRQLLLYLASESVLIYKF